MLGRSIQAGGKNALRIRLFKAQAKQFRTGPRRPRFCCIYERSEGRKTAIF